MMMALYLKTILKTILLSTKKMRKKRFIVMDIEIHKEWKLTHLLMKFGNTNTDHKEEMKLISFKKEKITDGQ